MGVGKSSLGQYLKHRLDKAVLLDGDWCWDADPFVVNDETKGLVLDNICHLLNSFLRCSVYENIVFSWVLDQQETIDAILARLALSDCRVRVVSLMASEETLRQRIINDVRTGTRTIDVLERSLARLPRYEALRSQKIQTDGLSAPQIAEILLA